MDVRMLEYIVAIEEEGNLSRAAERIHISQSALSQNLAKIESELGTPLFLRGRKHWVTTEVGKCYLRGARELIRIKRETYEALSDLPGVGSDAIRLAICPQVYTLYSGAIFSVMKETFPDLRLDVYRADSLLGREYLLDDTVDAAVLCASPVAHRLLEETPLYREQLVLVVPTTMAWEGEEVDMDRLSRLPFVMPSPGTHLGGLVEEVLVGKGIRFGNPYQAEDSEGIRLLVEKGYGAALLPRRLTGLSEEYKLYPWEPSVEYDVVWAVSRYTQKTGTLEQVGSLLCSLLAKG